MPLLIFVMFVGFTYIVLLLLQWRIFCFIIKLCLASFTISLAIGGAVQGTLGYHDYCKMEDRCRFSHRSDSFIYKMSYDFVSVVVFSATNAVWWVSFFVYVCVCACVRVCVCLANVILLIKLQLWT